MMPPFGMHPSFWNQNAGSNKNNQNIARMLPPFEHQQQNGSGQETNSTCNPLTQQQQQQAQQAMHNQIMYHHNMLLQQYGMTTPFMPYSAFANAAQKQPPQVQCLFFPLSLSPLPEISFSPCILSPNTEDYPACYASVFEIGQEGTERSTQWNRVRTWNWNSRCQLAVTECSCLNLPPFYHCVCDWYMHCGNALFSVYLDESIRHLKMRDLVNC